MKAKNFANNRISDSIGEMKEIKTKKNERE
jgi:hypothetical protein